MRSHLDSTGESQELEGDACGADFGFFGLALCPCLAVSYQSQCQSAAALSGCRLAAALFLSESRKFGSPKAQLENFSVVRKIKVGVMLKRLSSTLHTWRLVLFISCFGRSWRSGVSTISHVLRSQSAL